MLTQKILSPSDRVGNSKWKFVDGVTVNFKGIILPFQLNPHSMCVFVKLKCNCSFRIECCVFRVNFYDHHPLVLENAFICTWQGAPCSQLTIPIWINTVDLFAVSNDDDATPSNGFRFVSPFIYMDSNLHPLHTARRPKLCTLQNKYSGGRKSEKVIMILSVLL